MVRSLEVNNNAIHIIDIHIDGDTHVGNDSSRWQADAKKCSSLSFYIERVSIIINGGANVSWVA